MTLARVNKSYLESNLMGAPPLSRLDSLYADLQMHALSVSDGLSKVQASLGTDSLTTVLNASSNIIKIMKVKSVLVALDASYKCPDGHDCLSYSFFCRIFFLCGLQLRSYWALE